MVSLGMEEKQPETAEDFLFLAIKSREDWSPMRPSELWAIQDYMIAFGKKVLEDAIKNIEKNGDNAYIVNIIRKTKVR